MNAKVWKKAASSRTGKNWVHFVFCNSASSLNLAKSKSSPSLARGLGQPDVRARAPAAETLALSSDASSSGSRSRVDVDRLVHVLSNVTRPMARHVHGRSPARGQRHGHRCCPSTLVILRLPCMKQFRRDLGSSDPVPETPGVEIPHSIHIAGDCQRGWPLRHCSICVATVGHHAEVHCREGSSVFCDTSSDGPYGIALTIRKPAELVRESR